MVTPPALIAATPVGATTTTFFCAAEASRFSNVVLPVPAFPVRKKCLRVCRANCSASSNSGLVIMENPSSALYFQVITQGFVAFCPLGRHAREHRNGRVDIVIHDDITLAIVVTVQAADILRECPAPRNRHNQKQRVEARVVEAFAQVSACCENEALLLCRGSEGALGGSALPGFHATM